jgi:hypothetical protein
MIPVSIAPSSGLTAIVIVKYGFQPVNSPVAVNSRKNADFRQSVGPCALLCATTPATFPLLPLFLAP